MATGKPINPQMGGVAVDARLRLDLRLLRVLPTERPKSDLEPLIAWLSP